MKAVLPSHAIAVAVSALVAPIVPCSANKYLTCIKITWVGYSLKAVSCLESSLKLMMPISLGPRSIVFLLQALATRTRYCQITCA
jgi:hypothetical protein